MSCVPSHLYGAGTLVRPDETRGAVTERRYLTGWRPELVKIQHKRLFMLDSCVPAIVETRGPFLSTGCFCQLRLRICTRHWHQYTASGLEQRESQRPNLAVNHGSVSLRITFLFPQLSWTVRGLTERRPLIFSSPCCRLDWQSLPRNSP